MTAKHRQGTTRSVSLRRPNTDLEGRTSGREIRLTRQDFLLCFSLTIALQLFRISNIIGPLSGTDPGEGSGPLFVDQTETRRADRCCSAKQVMQSGKEGGVRVCGNAVLGYFWCGVAVIFISKYGIAVFRVQAVCGKFKFYVAVVGEKIVVSR